MERNYVKTRFSTRQMTMIGMLSAISIFLGLTAESERLGVEIKIQREEIFKSMHSL